MTSNGLVRRAAAASALPAAVALLGDRRWQVPSWDHARTDHAR